MRINELPTNAQKEWNRIKGDLKELNYHKADEPLLQSYLLAYDMLQKTKEGLDRYAMIPITRPEFLVYRGLCQQMLECQRQIKELGNALGLNAKSRSTMRVSKEEKVDINEL